MKKPLSRGEKLLFASPVLLLALVGVGWVWRGHKRPQLELPQTEILEGMRFSPDSQKLVIWNRHRKTEQASGKIVDVRTRAKICDLAILVDNSIRKEIAAPIWAPDGKSLLGRYYKNLPADTLTEVSIWDARSGAVQWSKTYPESQAVLLRELYWFDANGETLVGSGVPPMRYDVVEGKRLNLPDARFSQHPNGSKFNEKLGLFGERTGRGRDLNELRIVDYKSKRIVWKPKVETLYDFNWYENILCVQYDSTPNGKALPRESLLFNRLLLWDAQTRQSLSSPQLPADAKIEDVRCNPKQDLIALFYTRASVDGDKKQRRGNVVVWNYRTGRELWGYQTPMVQTWINAGWHYESSPEESYHLQKNLQWSPDGKRLATVHSNQTGWQLSVYDLNGAPRFERQPVGFYFLWSPDSKNLAFVTSDNNRLTGRTSSPRIEIHRFEE